MPIWAWKPVLIFGTVYCDWQVLHLITVRRSSFFNNVSGEWHALQLTYASRKNEETIRWLFKKEKRNYLTYKWTKNMFDLTLSQTSFYN